MHVVIVRHLKNLVTLALLLGILWTDGSITFFWIYVYCLVFTVVEFRYLHIQRNLQLCLSSISALATWPRYVTVSILLCSLDEAQNFSHPNSLFLPGLLLQVIYQRLFSEGLVFVAFGCKIVYAFIRELKYIVVALVYISCLCFIFIYAADLIYNTSSELFSDFTRRHFVSSDDSFFQFSLNHYTSRFSKPYAENSETINWYLTNDKDFFENLRATQREPVLAPERISFDRYEGEDVRFQCNYIWNITESNIEQYWGFNNVPLNLTDKHRTESVLVTQSADGLKVTIKFTLSIFYLENGDFGNYDCVVSDASEEGNKMCAYTLRKIKSIKDVMNIPVGNSVSIFNVPFQLLNNDSLTAYYSVNNVSIYQVCGADEAKCSMALRVDIWKDMFLYYGLESFDDILTIFNVLIFGYTIPPVLQSKAYDPTIIEHHFKFCQCSSAYGWHRIDIFREAYNERTNTTEILEVHFPVSRLVLPEPRRSLFPFVDDTELYEQLKLEALKKDNSFAIDENILKLIRANETKVAIFDTIMVCLLSIVFLTAVIVITGKVSAEYFKLAIKPGLHRIRKMYDSEFGEMRLGDFMLDDKDDDVIYDVFVSHSEDENDWAIRVLSPLLEERLRLRVCFPDRDFEQGQNIFDSFKQAISQSRKIVVILSNSYMADSLKKELQLYDILLRLIEKDLLEDNVLFLRYHPISLPLPQQWHENLRVIDLFSCDDDETIRQITIWVNQNKQRRAITHQFNRTNI